MKKIPPCFLHIREKYRKIKQRFLDYRMKNWQDTGVLLYWTTVLLFSLCVGLMSGTFLRPVWLGTLLVMVLAFFITIAALWVLKKILKLFLRNGIRELLSWLLLCMLCVIVLTGDAYTAGFTGTAVFAVICSLILALFLKSLWALIHHKVRTKTIFAALILTGVPVIACLLLLAGPGFEDTYIETWQNLGSRQEAGEKREGLTDQEKAEFAEEMKEGSYTVLTASYGVKNTDDFASGTVDISRFAKNEGLDGFLKERYQGYPMTEVPLSGIIWYPKEVSDCPTLFIVHGNHNWITDSYLGYEYLGTYLASHGYVVVSVDENACNGLSNENDGRAVLLLENIRQLEKYNRQKDHPLCGKMDYDNLALAGHSRGGEAIAAACLFNDLEYYPDNGNRKFSYDFSIQSLIAIAPSCGQYRPSDRDVGLKDVNYMVIHGANDQDVNLFMGMEQYENIVFSGEKDCIKTSLYLAGANHGQFNSLWGKYDVAEPINRVLNVKNFISEQEQQQIAKIFIKSFLDQTLGEQRQEPFGGLLTNCGAYEELLPETLYVQSYQTSDLTVLCDFEEDTRLETGSLEGVYIRAEHVNCWSEELLRFSNGDSRGNYAAVLKWETKNEDSDQEEKEQANEEQKEQAEICFSVPELNLEGKYLQFDVMDLQEDFTEEEARIQEMEILLTDSSGKEAVLSGGAYNTLYPAFLVRLNKLQYLCNAVEYKHQFQTFSIPAEAFEGVDIKNICGITLGFPGEKGEVAIDNVGIR